MDLINRSIARMYQYYQKLNDLVEQYVYQLNMSHNVIRVNAQSSQSQYVQGIRLLPIRLCDLKEKRPQHDSNREASQFSRRHAFALTSNYIDKRPSSFLDETRLLLLQMSRLKKIKQVNFQYFPYISFSICFEVYMHVHLIKFIDIQITTNIYTDQKSGTLSSSKLKFSQYFQLHKCSDQYNYTYATN